MATANILENKGDAKYLVQIKKDMQRATNKKTDLNRRIDVITQKITELQGQLTPLYIQRADLIFKIDEAIAFNSSVPRPAKPRDYTQEMAALATLNGKLDGITDDIAHKQLQLANTQAEVRRITLALDTDDIRTVWCVDYEPELAVDAEVVTLELNAETELIKIAPHTYVPVASDVDFETAKLAIINGKLTATDKAIAGAEAAIKTLELMTISVEQAIIAKTKLLPKGKSDADQLLALALQVELDKLNRQLYEQAHKKIAQAKKLKYYRLQREHWLTKSNARKQRIADLQALVAPELPYKPPVNAYTPKIQPVLDSGGSAYLYNASLLPAVQKWLPTYRKGRITALDYTTHLADVLLGDDVSDITRLNAKGVIRINKLRQLTAVPVHYGRCNSAAFEVGDDVVVYFDGNWQTGKVIGFAEAPRECSNGAFIYATTEGDRLLPSGKQGFAPADKPLAGEKAGNIDWTNGNKTVTWQGVHRYSRVDYNTGQSVYMDKVEYNFNLGRIAGAAFKGDIFIMFTFHASALTAYFLAKDKTVLGSQVIGTYTELTQIVAISPDCTKAAFIAIPVGQAGVQTVVVELAINFGDKTVSTSSATTQDVADDLQWLDMQNGLNGSRAARTIVNCVDYGADNAKKTFDVSTSISVEESGVDYGYSIVEDYPFGSGHIEKNTYTSVYKRIGSSTYSGIGDFATIAMDLGGTTTSYYLVYGSDRMYIGYGFVSDFEDTDPTNPNYAANLAYLQAHLPSFDGANLEAYEVLFINDLDLRKDLVAYTRVTETKSSARDGNYTLHTQYILKIGAYQYNYKPDHAYASDIANDEQGDYMASIDVSMSNNFFSCRKGSMWVPYIDIQYEIFYIFVRRNGYNALQRYRQNTHYDDGNFLLQRVGLGLHDKNGNKLLWVKPIRGVQYDEFLEVTFAREDAVVVKMTSTNQGLSNQIEILKGVV